MLSTYVLVVVTLCFTGHNLGQSFEEPGIFIAEFDEKEKSSQIRFLGGDPTSIFHLAETSNETDGIEITTTENSRIIGLSYDSDDSLLFWANDIGQTISRYSLTDNTAFIVYTNDTSDLTDLTVDWISNTVYWIDSPNQWIKSCDYNGQGLNQIVSSRAMTSLAVEPQLGYLYWSTAELDPKIHRTTLTGANTKVIRQLDTFLSSPFGLTIQYSTQRLYWLADDFYLTSDTNGENFEILFIDSNLNDPRDLDLYGGYYAVSDYGNSVIHFVDESYPAHFASLQSANNKLPTSAVFFDRNRQIMLPIETTANPATSQHGSVYVEPSSIEVIIILETVSEDSVTNVTVNQEFNSSKTGLTTLNMIIICVMTFLLVGIVATVLVLVACRKRKRRERILAGKRVDEHEQITFRALPEKPWQRKEDDEPMYAEVEERNMDEYMGLTRNNEVADLDDQSVKQTDNYQPLLNNTETKDTDINSGEDEEPKESNDSSDDSDAYENMSGYVDPEVNDTKTSYVNDRDDLRNEESQTLEENGHTKSDIAEEKPVASSVVDLDGYVDMKGNIKLGLPDENTPIKPKIDDEDDSNKPLSGQPDVYSYAKPSDLFTEPSEIKTGQTEGEAPLYLDIIE
ncbi:uncharacterized protein LOC144438511 [Glandiceps talaboti]